MHILWRWFKGTVWYVVVTLIGIAFYDFAPFNGISLWLGLLALCAVEWVVISKVRERLHF